MGFHFRRSVQLLPGIRLNIGKRRASVSIGGRGAHVTVGHGQVRETVGLPGTGLSYTHVERTHHQTAANTVGAAQPQALANVSPKGSAVRGLFWLALIVTIAVAVGLRYLP
jgi:hypothetical protein